MTINNLNFCFPIDRLIFPEIILLMKKPLCGILIVALFSCSKKQEVAETVFEKTFSVNIVDTVTIDPGDEILYLQNNLSQSSLDHEGKYLYNYNRRDNSFEI